MKKLLYKNIIGAVLVVILALIIMLPVSVNAKRGTPCFFYGVVLLDGENAPVGSIVTARIEQFTCTTSVYLKWDFSRYDLLVPLDTDLENRNGGNNGDEVYFSLTVDGATYESKTPSIWKLGTDIVRKLSFHTSPPPNPPVIETSSLPEGVVGVQYSETGLMASGGLEPYTWDASNLPSGLDLSEQGYLTGTPTKAGNFKSVFVVTDSYAPPQKSDEKEIYIRIWALGDADHSGTVDKEDIKAAVKIYLGMEPYTSSADINQDGKVDMVDAVLIRNMIP
jgi:hypothetical protein